MICPSCGHVNMAGAELCESCQGNLADQKPAQAPAAVLEETIATDPVSLLRPVAPVTVEPCTRVREVVRLLAEHNIGCVLIVFCDALVGIFSERDLLMRIGDRLDELADTPIRHFMTPAPETLGPGDSIAFALNRMALCDFRHIPIEENERPSGIVSVRDILAYATRQFPEILTPAN
ncbi:MAG TPA: CBS domain-containing protein [Phycisphaerae bacterium]|nr:CBS domain-containing protein [Phycisphaerae bacterium]